MFSTLLVLLALGLVNAEEYVDPKSGARWTTTGLPNRFESEEARKYLGVLWETPEERNKRPTVSHESISNEDLPRNFNARDEWVMCPSISEIRDQSACGSCWAFGATEAMSDRLCIHSRGRIQKRIGATDLLSCCSACGFGCNGGYPPKAWDYWKQSGIVTGGYKEKPSGCRSYPFPRCDHRGTSEKYPPCQEQLYPTPKCVKQCDDPKVKYGAELTKANTSYNILNNEHAIMKEIMKNGPIEVAFVVYEDFGVYRSGVYYHSWGRKLGGHAVRMLGWGVDQFGTPFWSLANSWNEDWGEHGYFRIIRGRNECLIESMAVAGLPDVSRRFN